MYIFILKCAFASNILWNLSIMAIKISVLHLYFSIFNSVTAIRRAVWATIILAVIFHSAFIIETFTICKPVAFYWDRGFNIRGTCGTARGSQLARFIPGVMSLALDVIIFYSLPLPVLWRLKMSISKKVATSSVFGIALEIVMVSAIRLKFIFETESNDYTKSVIKFAITGAMEPMVGIIVCCTPMIAPVITHITDGRIAMWTNKHSRSGTAGNSGGKSNLSWPHGSQKSYISGSKSPATKDFEMEDGDGEYPLSDRSGMKSRMPETGSLSDAEEGRTRITTDAVIDERPGRMNRAWLKDLR
ncbi:hypothetical protein K469DRAFT_561058 [Zopfia rhizophila CBS 207.26]|uniref:Rhodopsin domain-containing protein n=1 Tax=Zopfia rhizophila CBS 207.26 TaxID=1314779 RepID=A0A6A6EFT0_9PEZI|nr:hypothetical protein K469DRAFT_561058 [Zopfia rhizophila CBS 207.26]